MKNVVFFSLALLLSLSSCKEDLSQLAQVNYFLTLTNAAPIESIELPFLNARLEQMFADQTTTMHNTYLESQTCKIQMEQNPESMSLGSSNLAPCTIKAFDLNIDCWANVQENGETRKIAVMGIEKIRLAEGFKVDALANVEVVFELDWANSQLKFVNGEETLFPVFIAQVLSKN